MSQFVIVADMVENYMERKSSSHLMLSGPHAHDWMVDLCGKVGGEMIDMTTFNIGQERRFENMVKTALATKGIVMFPNLDEATDAALYRVILSELMDKEGVRFVFAVRDLHGWMDKSAIFRAIRSHVHYMVVANEPCA